MRKKDTSFVKDLLKVIGFVPKDGVSEVYSKKYSSGYVVEVDYKKESIDYGKSIISERDTTRNFSQEENWVVLECVNRLLEKGYKPEDIILEKKFTVGHGPAGGWLDIFVKKAGKAYLMIECKTWGKEFDKEWQNTQKKGGQLLSYLQQDKDTEFLVLYASRIKDGKAVYKNEIIKVEEGYRQMASNTEDLYNRWNKLSKQNGIFESWTRAYHFESKALTLVDLKEIQQEDSSFIFNRFLEILRHNAVSDKGNAFNRIFTLFLCKVYDEKTAKPDEELKFQWLEGIDDHISFQIRLTDLYKNGMFEFLSKQVTDFSEDEFEKKYKHLDDSIKRSLLEDFFRVRLEKNNEFAIKDVFDHQSFEDNAKVVKEVVELLQKYRIRYNKRQQYLSDFFELLLTTGLKQESGQFFTPVPVAQFIIKSLPLDQIIQDKIEKGEKNNLLPYIIDYAAGSGHFITESMHEVQGIINEKNPLEFISDTAKKLKSWQEDHFDWATQYVYGIEKDYRLVKVGKVGCYLHGDGLANVILSDGLARFSHTEYKGKLSEIDSTFPQDNKQFDILISNPPYSISSFANTSRSYYTEADFELYKNLTESSSEIECLFIERMKQLLKDGGIAGIILPSSILSNAGIYTRSREIILQYFDIVAITELGSNTFMATGTNTVVLFLRRKNNYESINLRQSIDKFVATLIDVTIDGIEHPVGKYIAHVWSGVTIDEYKTLLQKSPNKVIQGHEIYREYQKKIIAKTEKDFFEKVIELEKEKLFYFILAYPQQIVLVKSGEKDAEKKFLGYEFSNRRGNEGIHPIQKGKSIDECTQMFDPETFENSTKASTYIYRAFKGDTSSSIDDVMAKNVSRHSLVDMISWDRADFEKNISTSVKKKIKIESKWKTVKLGELVEILDGMRVPVSQNERKKGEYPYYGATGIVDHIDSYIFNEQLVLLGEDGAKWGPNEKSAFIVNGKYWVNNHAHVFRPMRDKIMDKYLVDILNKMDLSEYVTGINVPKLNQENLRQIQIPLPPLDIQKQIVREMEEVEKREEAMKSKISAGKNTIESLFENAYAKADMVFRLSDPDIFDVSIGQRVLKNEFIADGKIPVYSANVLEPFGYIGKLLIKNFDTQSVLWGIDGDWMVNWLPAGFEFYPTDHCGVLRVKNGAMNERYLAYALKKEGEKVEFSRQKRASIEKIQGIKIPAPSLSEQQKIVAEIEKIEAKIAQLEAELASIPAEKEAILKKYL